MEFDVAVTLIYLLIVGVLIFYAIKISVSKIKYKNKYLVVALLGVFAVYGVLEFFGYSPSLFEMIVGY